jgi:surface-anchored protein
MSKRLTTIVFAFCFAAARCACGFWIRLDDGHCHPIIDFDPVTGTWNAYVEHDIDGNWPPEIALLYVQDAPWPSGARIARPADPKWDFIGVPAHSNLWLLPQIEQPGLLWLGFANHSPFNTFGAYAITNDPRVSAAPAKWITYHLRDVRFSGVGAGHVSCWTTDTHGEPVVWFSTAAGGLTDADTFLMAEGGHVHVNWAFSDAGWYEIDLQASGFRHGSMAFTNSPVVTFYVGVGTTNAPRLTALSAAAGQAMINLTGTNLAYQIERSADGGTTWHAFGSPALGTGTNLWLPLPPPAPGSLFRYRVGHPN